MKLIAQGKDKEKKLKRLEAFCFACWKLDGAEEIAKGSIVKCLVQLYRSLKVS